jgi:chromosomal replication initiation ATPase DnaA
MKNELVSTENVRRCQAAAAELEGRFEDRELIGLGLIHGRPGLGKTTWLRYHKAQMVRKENGIQVGFVRALAIWSEASMLKDLLGALGTLPIKYRKAEMYDQLLDILEQSPTEILIDEIHQIAGSAGMMGIIKDLHDMTGCVVIMAGELRTDGLLRRHESFHDRLNAGAIITLREHTPDDMTAIVKGRCELEVEPEVCRAICGGRGRTVRQLLRQIREIESYGRASGIKRFTMKDFRHMGRLRANAESKVRSITSGRADLPSQAEELTMNESQGLSDAPGEANA